MATAGALLGLGYAVPEEERVRVAVREKETYPQLLARLSHQSVVKHFDAYADIAWDSEEYRVDADDPRWQLSAVEPLGATDWYLSQPAHVRSRIGLHHFAILMKIGVQFESALKRGLLDFAFSLPNHSPEFRYIYHEVIEEAQHSLMFQELVNRSGLEVHGLPKHMQLGSRLVVRLARSFPTLFFMFVMGGEDPIDHVQRTMLRAGVEVHPLLRRIMQIHVTEEARHLCFARHYLRQNVGQLSRVRKLMLSVRTPLILNEMASLMMRPAAQIVTTYGIPKAVMQAAYDNNPAFHASRQEALRKVRELCVELGVFRPGLWRRLGLWQPTTAITASA